MAASDYSSAEVNTAKQAIIEAGARLVGGGVLTRSNHGNISVRLGDTDRIVLTGGGTLASLTPDDLAVLSLSGELLDGHLDPVAHEIVHMHTAVYRARRDVGAVIHTHSPHATAFAIAGRPIECVYEGMARFGITDPVPVAAYGPRGSDESVRNIVSVIGPESRAVLLQNHGILVFDADIRAATQLVFVLEETAELAVYASLLGQPVPIPKHLAASAQQRRQEFERTGQVRA